MGEWSIVVGVATVVSPFWFVLRRELDIILCDLVWRGFAMSKMSEWSVVVGIS
jgi:hypothetical protein